MTTEILYCQPGAELYGSDRMASETVRALNAAGLGVHVVVPNTGPLVEEFTAGGSAVSIVTVPVLRKALLSARGLAGLVFGFPGAVALARRTIRASGARLVYVNTIIQPAWMIGARLARVPFVVHIREAEVDGNRLVQWMLHLPTRFAHTIIANSQSTAAHVSGLVGRDRSRVVVIHNGKDWTRYACPPFAAFSAEPRLLFLGRLSPRKGADVALEACILLHTEGVKAHLKFVGSTFDGYEWYENDLRVRAAAAGIDDFCTFDGFQDDPAPSLAAAELVLVPSRVEPFGTVAAEALASTRPTIVSAAPGLTEIVTDGVTGLVVPIDDPEALASATLALVRDPKLAARLAQAGHDFVVANFSAKAYALAVESVCRDALGDS